MDGGRPSGRFSLTRYLLPFWGEPRRNPDVPGRTRVLRMADAALRVGIGALLIWWAIGRT